MFVSCCRVDALLDALIQAQTQRNGSMRALAADAHIHQNTLRKFNKRDIDGRCLWAPSIGVIRRLEMVLLPPQSASSPPQGFALDR